MADWRDAAECRDAVDPDLWFPMRSALDQAATAKAICARCPVRRECLDDAMAAEGLRPLMIRDGTETWPARYGIRGGLDEMQRHDIARRSANATRKANRA